MNSWFCPAENPVEKKHYGVESLEDLPYVPTSLVVTYAVLLQCSNLSGDGRDGRQFNLLILVRKFLRKVLLLLASTRNFFNSCQLRLWGGKPILPPI